MFIEIGDTLTLEDDIKYVVVSMAEHKNKIWVYLVNESATVPIFCYIDGEDLIEIEDPDTISELLPLFIETASPLIEEIVTAMDENNQ